MINFWDRFCKREQKKYTVMMYNKEGRYLSRVDVPFEELQLIISSRSFIYNDWLSGKEEIRKIISTMWRVDTKTMILLVEEP